MEFAPDLTGYAHALGRAQAAWRFAGAELRRAAALATIVAVWETFRRDAGAGDVGPAHDITPETAQLLFTHDPRRDAMLLWLADHAVPAIAEAAATVVRMAAATPRFGAEERELLDVARDALTTPAPAIGPIGRLIAVGAQSKDSVLESLLTVAAAVDRLRENAGFLERSGEEVRLALPGGTFSRYVAAEPAGCWALNLALQSAGAHAAGVLPPPGMVSRLLFRSDVTAEEVAVRLVEDANAAWRGGYDRCLRLEGEVARGHDALAHLSRNARARDAWLLVAALGACKRSQLARALGLSRAGADIQAHALAEAGLVALSVGGQITWVRPEPAEVMPKPLGDGPLSNAVSDLDASLAEIDRLLARPVC